MERTATTLRPLYCSTIPRWNRWDMLKMCFPRLLSTGFDNSNTEALACHDRRQSLEAQREADWNLQSERECSEKISKERRSIVNLTWIVELPVLWVLANAILVFGWHNSSFSCGFITSLSLLCKFILLDLNKMHPKTNAEMRMNLRTQVFISVIL